MVFMYRNHLLPEPSPAELERPTRPIFTRRNFGRATLAVITVGALIAGGNFIKNADNYDNTVQDALSRPTTPVVIDIDDGVAGNDTLSDLARISDETDGDPTNQNRLALQDAIKEINGMEGSGVKDGTTYQIPDFSIKGDQ